MMRHSKTILSKLAEITTELSKSEDTSTQKEKKGINTKPKRAKWENRINIREMENASTRKITQKTTRCSRRQRYETDMATPEENQDDKHEQPGHNKEKKMDQTSKD